jgi:hypothetical protein
VRPGGDHIRQCGRGAVGCGGRRARRSGVTVEEWALIASVVFAGLFSGLYGMLNLILHKVMRGMNGPEFARFLRRFLTVARKSPFNYVVVIGMVLAPAVALIATDDAGGTPFVLTTIGLALTWAGTPWSPTGSPSPTTTECSPGNPITCRLTGRRGGATTSSSTGPGPSPPGQRLLSFSPRSWNRSNPHGAALTLEREPPAGEGGIRPRHGPGLARHVSTRRLANHELALGPTRLPPAGLSRRSPGPGGRGLSADPVACTLRPSGLTANPARLPKPTDPGAAILPRSPGALRQPSRRKRRLREPSAAATAGAATTAQTSPKSAAAKVPITARFVRARANPNPGAASDRSYRRAVAVTTLNEPCGAHRERVLMRNRESIHGAWQPAGRSPLRDERQAPTSFRSAHLPPSPSSKSRTVTLRTCSSSKGGRT